MAEAFESVHLTGNGKGEEYRAATGHHWVRAGEPERAVPHLVAAADRAQRFHSVSESIILLETALREIASIRSRNQASREAWRHRAVELEELYGDQLALQSGHAEARAAFDRAGKDAGKDPIRLARLLRKVGKTMETDHDHKGALKIYHKAEEWLGPPQTQSAPAWTEWIQIILNRVWIHYWLNAPLEIDGELEKIRPYVADGGTADQRYQYCLSLVSRNNRLLYFRIPSETRDFLVG